jgi:4-aminobutyrate aminotransferase-like enzyme
MPEVPAFSEERARVILEDSYGLTGALSPLPSERDQNFRLESSSGERFVLKIANRREDPNLIDAQNAAMSHLEGTVSVCPSLVPTRSGEPVLLVPGSEGDLCPVRLLTYIDGIPLGKLEKKSPDLLLDLGRKLGILDRAMQEFDHPAFHREFYWDLARGMHYIERYGSLIEESVRRRLIDHLVSRFNEHTAPHLGGLRRSVIYNDANDHNVIVDGKTDSVVGLIDFGDMVHSWTVGNLAIGIAYAMLDSPEPLDVAATITQGYNSEFPLGAGELRALHGLVCLRLCASVCIAAHQMRERPDDPYLGISQEPIRRMLPKLVDRPFRMAEEVLRDACARRYSPGASAPSRRPNADVLAERGRRLGANLSVAYRSPIQVSRGWMQYLYDTEGNRYLDAYNNVPHVGHCHPRVVEAATRQMRRLNTNTRYLYDSLGGFAERLAETLPDPLEVCFFLNSASEANELALRLARARTGGRDLIVQKAAYHGHTTTLIDISPYKHDGPGGEGAPSWVHKVPVPDLYRGPYRDDDPGAAARYAGHVRDACTDIRSRGRQLAAFIAETFPSVGGQLVPPEGYFSEAYEHVRAAGGVCVADEVQTGYGRIGEAFYAFETQGVVPDIVVLGKPIGNGHPLAAVVTTRGIADSFDTGMEFFSTFGGNTVSCEVGLAVLDTVLEEELQEHALRLGQHLQEGLTKLARKHEIIGNVRGSGFFLGVELVRNRETREPAGDAATDVVNRMREAGVLIGTDGAHQNVLKIRPPMPFRETDADILLTELDRALSTKPLSG